MAALERYKFSVKLISDNDKKSRLYTGLSWEKFQKLYTFLAQYVSFHGNISLTNEDQLFLTLIKFRQNPAFEVLGDIFRISKTSCWEIFWKWTDLLYHKTKFLIKYPDRENIFKTIPPVFREKYPRLTGIIDCFEIFIEQPHNLKARAKTYSNYKKHCTVKFLICCTPCGAVSFLSDAYGGRASDVTIVRESGFISRNYHFPGDQLLADRGFTLYEDFATQCGAELVVPAFTKGRDQLPAQEVEGSRKISNIRIHIERVIGLLKNRFNILQGTITHQLVKSIKDESEDAAIANIDKLVNVCAVLVNLGDSIVYQN